MKMNSVLPQNILEFLIKVNYVEGRTFNSEKHIPFSGDGYFENDDL